MINSLLRRLIYAVAAILIPVSYVSAEKLEDRYVVKTISEGQLYFIRPYKVTSSQKLPAAECDITYLLGNDSLTFNFSIYLPEAITADSIVIGKGRHAVTDFETFYINHKNKKYVHRYSCRLSYQDFCSLYKDASPFCLSVHENSRHYNYSYKANSWKKEGMWMRQILFIIERNRISKSVK